MSAAVLVALALKGASAPTGIPPEVAAPPQENEALVYIYRTPGFILAARRAGFLVDNVKIADLYGKECTAIRLPAGEHVLKQKWAIDVSFQSLKVEANWEGGKTYYYVLSTGLGANSIAWGLTEGDAASTAAELSGCKFKPPRSPDEDAETPPSIEAPASGA